MSDEKFEKRAAVVRKLHEVFDGTEMGDAMTAIGMYVAIAHKAVGVDVELFVAMLREMYAEARLPTKGSPWNPDSN